MLDVAGIRGVAYYLVGVISPRLARMIQAHQFMATQLGSLYVGLGGREISSDLFPWVQ